MAGRRPPQPSGGRKSDATRRRILDAAAAVFRAKGYAGARLSDIAAARALWGCLPGSLSWLATYRRAGPRG